MCPPDDGLSDLDQEKALGLFKFLRDFSELRTKTIRSLDNYEDVLWISDIPKKDGCHAAAWFRGREDDEDHLGTWVEIRKPTMPEFPEPSEELARWLDLEELHDSSTKEPTIRDWIFVENEEAERQDEETAEQTDLEDQPKVRKVVLNDCSDIQDALFSYLDYKWRPWAELDREARPIQTTYSNLFHLFKSQQRLGEQYEVVLGIGLLRWRLSSGQTVRRHVIAAQTSLELEAASGTIRLGPAGEGAKLLLEQDMLDPAERPDVEVQKKLQEQLTSLADNAWDVADVDSVLKSWVNDIASGGEYFDTLKERQLDAERPTISYAPAILFRKRTERSYIRVFEEIIDRIKSEEEIPKGVERFISIVSDPYESEPIDGDTQHKSRSAPDPEVYFPLEANSAQKKIIATLNNSQGVLVQGPPGTGKSHTIVNLVAHLLASGKRVLVTSHTARALSVLRGFFEERLPELAPLAVVVLGDDRTSLKAMEESVLGITNEHNKWDKEKNLRIIEDTEKKLADCRVTRQKVNEDLRSIREQETYKHPPKFGGYKGSLQEIATQLNSEKESYGFFQDSPGEDDELQVTIEELHELLHLLRDPSVEEIDVAEWQVVDPSELKAVDKIQKELSRETELKALYNGCLTDREQVNYQVFGKCSPEVIGPIESKFKRLISLVDDIEKHIEPWTQKMLRDVLADLDRPWWELRRATESDLDLIEQTEEWGKDRLVSGIEERDFKTLRVDATALLEHLESGKKWGFGPFRANVVKHCMYLKINVRFDGHPCDSQPILKAFIGWLDVQILLLGLSRRLSEYTNVGDIEPRLAVAKYRDLCEPIVAGKEAFDLVRALQAACGAVPSFVAPVWHEIVQLRSLCKIFEALEIERKLFDLQESFKGLAEHWQRKIQMENLDPAIEKMVGALRDRDIQSYTNAYNEVSKNFQQGGKAQRRYALLASLKALAPKFVDELKETSLDSVWEQRISVFPLAWKWARAKTWVARLADPYHEQTLRDKTAMLSSKIREHLESLAAKKAWNHCLGTLTENERQSLIAWSKAMMRLGRGTGRNAPLHRRAARKHMEQCRTAIPAWVMPMYRVAETMRPGVDMFDVAIVDEASQSGPEALLLTYLAKRIVVVGDSKQIVPDFVGVNREDVDALRRLHLQDIPHGDALGADGSFFDLAEIRYQGSVVLREHFRCMPEIIQFSNNLCYSAQPLIPLRQYPADRLKPVVEAVYVEGGYREGESSSAINKPEANAIVDRIVSMTEDPHYKEKTIGVITLLGNTQPRLIEQKLLERIGPEKMEEHAIVCGNAYAFQGDERDVIIVSMVSAVTEGYRIGARTRPADERRFNVAASRARDQLILFHSVTLNDLSSACLQRRFLAYCMEPAVDPLECDDISVSRLRELFRTVQHRVDNRPKPFGSWFEVDVFIRISERGYRVSPQIEINGYEIDLVVEGMQGRLAVECDGDYWHGPEQYESDAGRQKTLERCGWQFWRVRGSTFYLDPDAALEDLWKVLADLDIQPGVGARDQAEASTADVTTLSSVETENTQAPVQIAPLEESFTESDLSSPESVVSEVPSIGIENLSKEPKSEENDQHASSDLSSHTLEKAGQKELEMLVPDQLPDQLPDPRSTLPKEVTPYLIKIVEDNGPIIIHHACQLYVRGAGFKRMGKDLRSALNKSMAAAIHAGTIEAEQEPGSSNFKDRVVRKKGLRNVITRQLGARVFGDVPILEIAAVMEKVKVNISGCSGTTLYRKVLDFYGIKKLTKKAQARLELAEKSLLD